MSLKSVLSRTFPHGNWQRRLNTVMGQSALAEIAMAGARLPETETTGRGAPSGQNTGAKVG